jgi:hypothetical protein
MPYGYIVIVAVIALTVYYVFLSEASLVSKIVVAGILGICLLDLYWLHKFGLWDLFLMVGLGIYISMYRLYAKARSSNGRD